jgi:hypothetical protein
MRGRVRLTEPHTVAVPSDGQKIREGAVMTDRLAYVRDRALRDLIEQLDHALETPVSCDCNEDGAVLVKQRDLSGIESTLEAAAGFLHELRLKEMVA